MSAPSTSPTPRLWQEEPGAASAIDDSRAAVLEELRAHDKFLLVTHEHPDGDALGSLIALNDLLRELGKDSVLFIAADEFPLPHEYRFLAVDGHASVVPPDIEERALVYLDCGNLDRNPLAPADGARIVNIDHHHDNTLFGTVNHVVPGASCTAEIVWDLMHGLGLEPTLTVAEALYVGLITDTGRFMYANTGVRAHLMAAELVEAGVDAFDVYRRIYEGVPPGKLQLLGRALCRVSRYDEGRLTVARLTSEDFRESDAEESYAEGVIDHLRALQGTLVAALVRDRLDQPGLRKVSLRASDQRVDVSRIARERGGGGHPQAAGFTTELEGDELVDFLRRELSAQLG